MWMKLCSEKTANFLPSSDELGNVLWVVLVRLDWLSSVTSLLSVSHLVCLASRMGRFRVGHGSPLSETPLGQAWDDDGVKGLLGAGDGDAQRAAVALQLHRVDDGAGRLLLVWTEDTLLLSHIILRTLHSSDTHSYQLIMNFQWII